VTAWRSRGSVDRPEIARAVVTALALNSSGTQETAAQKFA
jgi:hypothetical protein